jgi:pilus assembly protein FimV
VYDDADETGEVTGQNPEVDPEVTGVQTTLDPQLADLAESLKVEEEDLTATAEMRLARDETGMNPMLNTAESDADDDLLNATGQTQILSEDLPGDTATGEAGQLSDNDATLLSPGLDDDASFDGAIADDEATLMASLDDDDDFDFAKTEALTAEVFTGDTNLDATGEMPAMSNADETVEYPLSSLSDDEVTKTLTLGASALSDELQEARTMTEVGTKLDLARAYVDMGDPAGARSILEEVLVEGDDGQRQQAQSLIESLPA